MSVRAWRLSLAGLMLLSACGGGGGGGGSERAANPPAAPTLGLTFGYKELQFSWAVVPEASFYRVHENADGVSGYTQVSADISATAYNHGIVSLFQRLNASYLVDACNSAGCTASAPVSIPANLPKAFGAYVKASNTEAGDSFGSSIAVSGDGNTLAVGARDEDSAVPGISVTAPASATDNDSALSAGAVYVFTRSGSTWTQEAYIKASNPQAGDDFGISVALSADGSTLAVGARDESGGLTGVMPGAVSEATAGNGALFSGAVYVFTRSGSTWSQQAYVKASNTEANDAFGASVALSSDGNTLAVGAHSEGSATPGVSAPGPTPATDDDSAPVAGAVYVFTRSVSTWTQQAYIKASNPETLDFFGISVALSSDGNTLAVGASDEASALTGVRAGAVDEATAGNGASRSGAVYVFTRSGVAWSQSAYVKASNAEAGDNFGISVTLSADGLTLAVGASGERSPFVGLSSITPTPGADNDSAGGAGAVYVFTRFVINSLWVQQAYIKASNAEALDDFGISVALSADGNTLAVGAEREDSAIPGISATVPSAATDDEGAQLAGAVYVFTRSGSTWTQQAYVKAPNADANDFFGVSVALSSDGNTLAVGASREGSAATGIGGSQTDNSAPSSGAVYLY